MLDFNRGYVRETLRNDTERYLSAAMCLGMAFTWKDAPQGHRFWADEFWRLYKGGELSPEAREALEAMLLTEEV